MLIGTGILTFLCIFMGVYPKILYDMLPYLVEYVPFTFTRVFSITQMFIFTFLGFWLLRKLVRGYPSYVFDTDWLVMITGRRFDMEGKISSSPAISCRALGSLFISTVGREKGRLQMEKGPFDNNDFRPCPA
jgi:hypothetical protein